MSRLALITYSLQDQHQSDDLLRTTFPVPAARHQTQLSRKQQNQESGLTAGQYRNHDYTKPNDEQDLKPFERPLQVSIELALMSSLHDLETCVIITHPYATCIHQCYSQKKHECCGSYTETATPVLRTHRCSTNQHDCAHAVCHPRGTGRDYQY